MLSPSAAIGTNPARTPVLVRCVRPASWELAATHAHLLTPEERRRAARFHRCEDRTSFVLAHAALRDLLATALDRAPSEVLLAHDNRGKPGVTDHPQLAWNLTRAQGLSLIALREPSNLDDGGASTPAVGIDVEPSHRQLCESMVERICTSDERAQIDGLSLVERRTRLLQLWVRKEAVAKADGSGLGLPFTNIEIGSDGEVAIIDRDTPMWVCDLDVGNTHVSALATAGAPSAPELHQWP